VWVEAFYKGLYFTLAVGVRLTYIVVFHSSAALDTPTLAASDPAQIYKVVNRSGA
jgi:hypothetical protein